ncbi:LSU ribosomal protein L9p [Caenispirillum salinarum AK4]|uniref:Large ribosomal subunit protein bL9 n=1 Tax=Caenispirillum salinarum AK4 TaxID=1238182 RepID=K9GY45_9PROT|nr:50S ribosomal protein L9 [Caenispirillum salinarum]EKV30157.1 LSU ribosomal protein L9p [Caenispirillum salinarum AK4]
MTEVILLERIVKLGQMGDTVKVKPGYARNYLLPQGKALRASEKNKQYFESQKAQIEARNLERRKEALDVAERMKDLNLIMVRQAGEGGQLYGSVTARDVADAIKEQGYSIERGMVEMHQPIKSLGRYEVPVMLHAEVTLNVPVTVARSQEEGENQVNAADLVEADVDIEDEVLGFDNTPESVEAEEAEMAAAEAEEGEEQA